MSSTRVDISVVGASKNEQYRVAASATRFYVGEPLEANTTHTSGVSDTNTVVQAADAIPVIGTDTFVGIAAEDAPVGTDTTVDAAWFAVTEVIANYTRMRAKAKTTGNVDTLTELVGLLFDFVLFDITSGTFTIDETAAADTSGLTIRGGIWEQSLLEVTVDPRAQRHDIS